MFEIEEDQMKTYDKADTCIKCGYGGIEDVHQDAESQASCDIVNNFNKGMGRTITPLEPLPERIARTCKNCGYSWNEKPLPPHDPAYKYIKVRTFKEDVKYKRCWPNKEEIRKWMDGLADAIAPAVGIPPTC